MKAAVNVHDPFDDGGGDIEDPDGRIDINWTEYFSLNRSLIPAYHHDGR